MSENLLLVFELIGTVAFAASGAMVGLSKKMDIFGIAVLGIVTSVGGGIIRDLVLGNTPPATFQNPVYALVAIFVSLIIFIPAVRRFLFKKQSIYEKTIVVAANTKILHKQMIDILNDNQTDVIGKIGIVGRIDQDRSILFSAEIVDYLLTNGIEVQIEKRLAKKIIELKENPKLEEIIRKTKQTYPQMANHLENIDFNIDYEKIYFARFDILRKAYERSALYFSEDRKGRWGSCWVVG